MSGHHSKCCLHDRIVSETPSACEVNLEFNDSKDPIVVRDATLIKKLGNIHKVLEANNADWETTIANVLVKIPFKRDLGDFLIRYLQKHEKVSKCEGRITVIDYPEASEKSIDELKEIIQFAHFMKCFDFMNCVVLSIEKKLFGQWIMNPDRSAPFNPDEGGWILPPNVIEEETFIF
ncbi:hypothetical protein CRE_24383 [Caenorhabditis remanei]|uniref:Uncharacterized protein n=1 Tax=Caenorhabditis remanei TaxID=31234 RepID=E3MFP5_CAERE|nr:hypothetical protein CRE_24383 [Caenorhabditis remanei]